jgi:hypothetical protein
MPYGDNEFFFRTKFLQINGLNDFQSEEVKDRTILYNPYVFDWIKTNYTGIESEADLEV